MIYLTEHISEVEFEVLSIRTVKCTYFCDAFVRQISRHKKRAPERHVYFYYYNPLDQGQVINCQIYDHVFFTSVVTPAGLNKLNNDLL